MDVHANHPTTDPSEVKACIAALTFILNNGAKYNVDGDTLTNELQQLGLPKGTKNKRIFWGGERKCRVLMILSSFHPANLKSTVIRL